MVVGKLRQDTSGQMQTSRVLDGSPKKRLEKMRSTEISLIYTRKFWSKIWGFHIGDARSFSGLASKIPPLGSMLKI